MRMLAYHRTIWLAVAAVALALGSCKSSGAREEGMKSDAGFTLTSSDFAAGGAIPKQFTCKGENISPALAWTGAPAGALSYVLIVEDPDAPMGTFTHWVAYDIPSDLNGLKRAATQGFAQGKNDFGKAGYGGPCPPSGTHHYVFKLFALSQKLGLGPGAEKNDVLTAMKGKVLAQTSLT